MTTPLPRSTSDTARLLNDAPEFGVGWQEPVYLPNPAAGAGLTYIVDGRYYERVLAVTFTLVTSAVVANRFVQLYLLDTNGKIITSIQGAGTVVASTTVNVFLMLRAPTLSNGPSGGSFGFLPDLLLPPGWKWQITVFGEDAADQISAVVFLVQRFPNDAAAVTAG